MRDSEFWPWVGLLLFGVLAVTLPLIIVHLLVLYGG